jgi:2-acylglycerol O-acyltransferase 2
VPVKVNTVTCDGKGFVTSNIHEELPHSFYSTTDNSNYLQCIITSNCILVQSSKLAKKKEKGLAAVLIPGGALEALNVNSDKDKIRLVLNRRKGFIKLALRFGVSLVPTFSFGENFIYDQIKPENGSLLQRFQVLTEKWIGFTPVLFFGRGIFQYNFGLLPNRKKITVVVGKPISVDKIEEPTRDQIESLHSKYVQELENLYNEYNPKYGDLNVTLEID